MKYLLILKHNRTGENYTYDINAVSKKLAIYQATTDFMNEANITTHCFTIERIYKVRSNTSRKEVFYPPVGWRADQAII